MAEALGILNILSNSNSGTAGYQCIAYTGSASASSYSQTSGCTFCTFTTTKPIKGVFIYGLLAESTITGINLDTTYCLLPKTLLTTSGTSTFAIYPNYTINGTSLTLSGYKTSGTHSGGKTLYLTIFGYIVF